MQELLTENNGAELYLMYERQKLKYLEKDILHSNLLFIMELENKLTQKIDKRIEMVFNQLLPQAIQYGQIALQNKQVETNQFLEEHKQKLMEVLKINQEAMQKSEQNFKSLRELIIEGKAEQDKNFNILFSKYCQHEQSNDEFQIEENDLNSQSFMRNLTSIHITLNKLQKNFIKKEQEDQKKIAKITDDIKQANFRIQSFEIFTERELDKQQKMIDQQLMKLNFQLNERNTNEQSAYQMNEKSVLLSQTQKQNSNQSMQKGNIENFTQFKKFIPNEKIVEFINKIYNLTSRLRQVPVNSLMYVQDQQSFQELCQHYKIQQQQINVLQKICNGFRKVRGDGNCFYTAFGFQILHMLLVKFDDQQYQFYMHQMRDSAQKMGFEIRYNAAKKQDKKFGLAFYQEFLDRIQNFRENIQSPIERGEKFVQYFSQHEQDYYDKLNDGCLYGLSCIYFRNLASHLVQNSSLKESVYDKETLLEWEKECNCNEVVIVLLSQFFQVQSTLVFFQGQNFTPRAYNQDASSENKVILLIQPGHYNIGIEYINSI